MNQKILTASLAALVLTTGAFSVQAESTSPNFYSLDEVVVTASRTPEKKIDANADVAVVTADEIAQKHYDDVSQAVRNVPGVVIANSSANGQNYNSNKLYINGSNKVVLLVDGVRMNTNGLTTGSAVTLAQRVNMNSIERIEVLKGSASTLYGSDAQGGVINIITKKADEGKINTVITTSGSSFDGEKYNLYNEGSKDGFFWTVEAQKELQGDYKDAHGNKVINHLNAEAYNVKLGKDLGNDSSLVFTYNKYKSDYQRPDQAFMHQGGGNTTRDYGKKDNDSLSLQYKAKITNALSNELTIYRNRTTFQDNYRNSSASWLMNMKSTGFTDQLTWKNDQHTVVGGVDYYKDELPQFYSYGETNNAQGYHVSNTAFYIQDDWKISDKWNVTPGVRFDHHSTFGNHTTPAITIGYKADENTNYYLGYKEFFVAPDLYQLFDKWSGKKDLEPQEGNTWQIGMNKQINDSLSMTLNLYRTHAQNLIIYNYDTWKYDNLGNANNAGGSLSLTKQFTPNWSATLGYTYTHVNGSDTQKANLNGFLPKHTLDLGVAYTQDKFDASLYGRAIWGRESGKGYTGKIPSGFKNYSVWNFSMNYKPVNYAKIFFKVNNLFDAYYCDVGTFSTSSYGDTTDWYSMPGRNYELGVTFQF